MGQTKGVLAQRRATTNALAKKVNEQYASPTMPKKPAGTTETYRRPDGSTYKQYGGPKSAQDVLVPKNTINITKAPKPKPSPTPTPTPILMGVAKKKKKP